MKIIIDGKIIDTELIYKISDVYEENWDSFGAKRYFFNISIVNVEKPIQFYSNYLTKDDDMEPYKDMVEDLRKRVVAVWTENQSDIPRFDLDISFINKLK